MTGSNTTTTSTTPVRQSMVVSAPNSVYISLIAVELASIAIKYQGLTTNPFQQSTASMLLFLIATFCHAIALTAKTTLPTTILFHVSGVAACEALLWILVAELLWCILINVLVLLVMALVFYQKHICELLIMCFGWVVVIETCSTLGQDDLGTADQMADLEAQEGIEMESQVTGLEPANIM